MRTYLRLVMDSEGAPFSELATLLADLGFRPVQGEYDFLYEWDREATVRESLFFADRVHTALKGKRIWFQVETVPDPP